MLGQQHGDRVDLLAGGAAGNPDAHRIAGSLALEQVRNDFFFQYLKGLGIAEEVGHADQQVAEQQRRFHPVLTQVLDIVLDIGQPQCLHPALDAAQESVVLVAPEIVPDLVAQDGGDGPASLLHPGCFPASPCHP